MPRSLLFLFLVVCLLGTAFAASGTSPYSDFTKRATTQVQATPSVVAALETQAKAAPTELRVNNFRLKAEAGKDKFSTKLRSFTPSGLGKRAAAQVPATVYGYVVVEGLKDEVKLKQMTDLGIKIIGFAPPSAYLAKIPGNKLAALESLSFVKIVSEVQPQTKLLDFANYLEVDATGAYKTKTQTASKPLNVEILLFEADPNQTLKASLEAAGATAVRYDALQDKYLVTATPQQLLAILALDNVQGILEHLEPKPLVYNAVAATGHDFIRPGDLTVGRYDGAGVSVGISDSDYYQGHVDLPDLTECDGFVQGCDGPPEANHGTAIAGILLGRGIGDPRYRGMAPGITEVYTSGPSDGSSVDLATQSEGYGGSSILARCFVPDKGIYDSGMAYVVAAGNSGPTSGTIDVPACSKNVITVGAIASNNGVLENYSSRGPTVDGRVKPDLVAPATVMAPSKASPSAYQGVSGTSVATPVVSGAVATLLQHYPNLKGDPPAVKALLLTGSIYPNAQTTLSRNDYGMGKLQSYLLHYQSVSADGTNGWDRGYSSFSFANSGEFVYFDLTVPANTARLVTALTWIEPAAASTATQAVIHDLDLYIDRGADQPAGNAGEYSSTSTIDNVEVLTLNNPTPGTYRLKAYARSIVAGVGVPKAAFAYTLIKQTAAPALSVDVAFDKAAYNPGDTVIATVTVSASAFIADAVTPDISSIGSPFTNVVLESKLADGTDLLGEPWIADISVGAPRQYKVSFKLASTQQGTVNAVFGARSFRTGLVTKTASFFIRTPPTVRTTLIPAFPVSQAPYTVQIQLLDASGNPIPNQSQAAVQFNSTSLTFDAALGKFIGTFTAPTVPGIQTQAVPMALSVNGHALYSDVSRNLSLQYSPSMQATDMAARGKELDDALAAQPFIATKYLKAAKKASAFMAAALNASFFEGGSLVDNDRLNLESAKSAGFFSKLLSAANARDKVIASLCKQRKKTTTPCPSRVGGFTQEEGIPASPTSIDGVEMSGRANQATAGAAYKAAKAAMDALANVPGVKNQKKFDSFKGKAQAAYDKALTQADEQAAIKLFAQAWKNAFNAYKFAVKPEAEAAKALMMDADADPAFEAIEDPDASG